LGAGDVGIFSFPAQQVVTENFVTTRLDYKISQKDNLSGTYLYDNTVYQSPDSMDVQLVGSRTRRQIVALEENHVFGSNLINTVRAGYSRDGVVDSDSISAINPLAADTSLAAIPGSTAAQTLISSVTPFTGGLSGFSHYLYYWNSFQGYDDVFVTHGTHSLKFGVAVERIQLNMKNFSNSSGVFRFGNLAGFLTNHPTRFNGPSSDPRDFRQTVFGAYAQDDWHLRPNLTLNLGLRYEMATVVKEVLGRLSNLVNITDSLAQLGNPLYLNPTTRNFEPRVGFAWDPFRTGKTADDADTRGCANSSCP
jgi:outer membrane receptor protein involved in Fe transport